MWVSAILSNLKHLTRTKTHGRKSKGQNPVAMPVRCPPTTLHKTTPAPAKVNCHLSKTPLITVCYTSFDHFRACGTMITVKIFTEWRVRSATPRPCTQQPVFGPRFSLLLSCLTWPLFMFYSPWVSERFLPKNEKKISCNTRYNGFQGMWLIETRHGMSGFGEG